MREREKCSTPLKNFTFIEKLRPDIRNNSETLPSRRAAHIKRSRDTKKKKSTPTKTVYRTVTQVAAQRSQHGEQKQCQTTPKREDIHIHSVEQDQPQGRKTEKQRNTGSLTNKLTNRITNSRSYSIR